MPFLLNKLKKIHSTSKILVLLSVLASQGLMAEDPQLEFTQVSDLSGIVDITNAGDYSQRVFLVEQTGRIFVLKDGQTLVDPFLDIRSRVMSGGERGLLSLAFAPDYKSSGYFYVWYTQNGGDTVLSRFRVGDDPDIADMNSEEKLLTVAQPFANHNGGRLQFGPDGMLYLGLGDGGSANDPGQRAQDGSTLLGKLIRIDVDPANGTFVIPADNPFVGDAGVRDEIWAVGLRNPWKISFDPKTGDLYIADVGQSALEEVNFQAANSAGGENYGWDIMEGGQCVVANCDQSGLTMPVTEYTHADGCSITGGEVYRGQAYPNLNGSYLFGDFCSGKIWGLHKDGDDWVTKQLADTAFAITTFGVAEDRSIFLANQAGGIYLVSDGAVKPEVLSINLGFNDAWYNPATNGQGFFITVFPDLGVVSVAWFTYDTELPPEDATANLGNAGQRWMTAQGAYSGNQAVLDIYQAEGGIFDMSAPAPELVKDGTIILEFTSCNSGTVTYNIPSIGREGVIPIERVAVDNVGQCESLQ